MTSAPNQRGSIFSGLLLIFLGSVFLFEHFHPAFRLWHYFYRFWPLLLIVWGLAKLIDHLSAQRSGEGKPPLLSGGEAALMVLVVFVFIGLGVKSWVAEKEPGMNLDVDMFSKDYSESEELPAKTLPANAHVTLTTERGDISAHTSEGDGLRVMANKSASGPTESEAQERMKKVKVVIEQTGGGYVVHPVNEGDSQGTVGVDLNVTLPPKIALWANTSHGNISISEIAGPVTAGSGNGDIEIRNSGSDVSAKMSKGDARITGVAGKSEHRRARQRNRNIGCKRECGNRRRLLWSDPRAKRGRHCPLSFAKGRHRTSGRSRPFGTGFRANRDFGRERLL